MATTWTQVVDELLDNPALGTTQSERVSALFTGGLKIYTNEVPSLQSHAQQVAVADIPSSLAHVVAAFAVIDPRNGNVEALVGGPNPRHRPVRRRRARRAPARFRFQAVHPDSRPRERLQRLTTRSWPRPRARSCSPGVPLQTATTWTV